MKKLQKNYTTPEQSRRLLELGVPAWTADFFYPTKKSDMPIIIVDINVGWNLKHAIPCWSVGRLIEIDLLCAEEPTNFVTNVIFFKGNNMSNIEVLIDSIKTTSMDFSKLDK